MIQINRSIKGITVAFLFILTLSYVISGCIVMQASDETRGATTVPAAAGDAAVHYSILEAYLPEIENWVPGEVNGTMNTEGEVSWSTVSREYTYANDDSCVVNVVIEDTGRLKDAGF